MIAPRIESTLGFRVSGKIIERFVNVGDTFKADQKIARLDEVDLKLAENSARAAVDQRAKTRRRSCQGCPQQGNYLLPNGFIAQAAVDQRAADMDAAQSALDSAETSSTRRSMPRLRTAAGG